MFIDSKNIFVRFIKPYEIRLFDQASLPKQGLLSWVIHIQRINAENICVKEHSFPF